MPESENSVSVGAFLWAVKDHWLTLMSGGIITVLLGVFERFSGKNVPLWVYVSILIFFAFLACYLAWRDAQNKLFHLSDKGAFKREFLAERLRTLLRDAEEAIKANNAKTSIIYMEALSGFLPLGSRARILHFLQAYYDQRTIDRFNEYGLPVVEELLADCYKDDSEGLSVIQKNIDTRH